MKVELLPGQELRLLLKIENGPCSVTLLSGTAEFFGTELGLDVKYSISRLYQSSVFSYHGCSLLLDGQGFDINDSYKVVVNNDLNVYVNIHSALETHRAYLDTHHSIDTTSKDNKNSKFLLSPSIMIIGAKDSGKSTLSRILLNYAVKTGRKPLYIDLDTNEGSMTLPGSISASAIKQYIDIEEGFSAPVSLTGNSPLSYYYGYNSPLEAPSSYLSFCNKLSYWTNLRLQDDEHIYKSGSIINTPFNFVEEGCLPLLINTIIDFNVNYLVILDSNGLEIKIKQELKLKEYNDINIIELPRANGSMDRDEFYRKFLQQTRIKDYFYGTFANELRPYTSIIYLSDCVVRRIAQNKTDDIKLINQDTANDNLIIVKAGSVLLHSILGLSVTDDSSKIFDNRIAGFVYVVEVDNTKGNMTVLSTVPGKIPKKVFIMGSYKWADE